MIIKTEHDEIINYLSDAANYKGECDAVYFPENTQEVIDLIKRCNNEGIKITASGNGTGLTGGRVPEGGIVLSLEKMNRMIEINPEKKYAVVEPGAILRDIQETVEKIKLFYPPDPTERDSFIGANAANNSSGAKTFKYGPTRDYILELEIVLPTGDLLNIKRGTVFADGYKLKLVSDNGTVYTLDIPDYKMPETKHAAGYYCKPGMDAIDIFIGSEGTLGIITKLKLKLIDLPGNVISCVVFFDNEDNAFSFVEEARNLSYKSKEKNITDEINARGLEFFDYYSLKFMTEDYPRIPIDAKAAIWFEQESNSSNEQILIEKWSGLINKHHGNEETSWFALDKPGREELKVFRHAIALKVTDFIAKNNIGKIGTDMAVPHDKFREFYNFEINTVKNNNLNYIVYGHIGNSHLHLNMLPSNPEQYEQAKLLYAELIDKAIELNGTISAEHGIGKIKRAYLVKMFGEANIKKMAKLKKQLDPNLILGIGNMFDPAYLYD